MLTEKDCCDYETCIALHKLGYDCQVIHLIAEKITLYEAQKWLREEKKMDVLIELETKDIHLSSKYYSIYISYMSNFRREFSYISKNFDSYEEALSEGIKEAVKILKKK